MQVQLSRASRRPSFFREKMGTRAGIIMDDVHGYNLLVAIRSSHSIRLRFDVCLTMALLHYRLSC